MDTKSFKAKTFTYKGKRISYLDSEKGDTVLLLLHGWLSCKEEYVPVAKKISEYYPNLRFLIPDLPGFGISESLEEKGEYTKVALSLLNAFLKEYSEYPIYVFGNSFGGVLSLKLLDKEEYIKGAVIRAVPIYGSQYVEILGSGKRKAVVKKVVTSRRVLGFYQKFYPEYRAIFNKPHGTVFDQDLVESFRSKSQKRAQNVDKSVVSKVIEEVMEVNLEKQIKRNSDRLVFVLNEKDPVMKRTDLNVLKGVEVVREQTQHMSHAFTKVKESFDLLFSSK